MDTAPVAPDQGTSTVFVGIRELVTMTGPRATGAAHDPEAALGIVSDAAVVCGHDGRVTWVGPRQELPEVSAGQQTIDLGDRVVLPGLVDCHTHVVFAGDRTHDYEARCAGVSYQEIARRGGGIRLTVGATRRASVDQLVDLTRGRLQELIRHGVTTIEIKSGYGLSVESELRILEVVARLAAEGPWRLVPTLLAAHIVPDEFAHDRGAYVRLVCDELMPEVVSRGLARNVDVFCDVGAFTLDETLTILERGRSLGLGLKVHAEQLTHSGASGAAARLGALSADHLEHIGQEDIAAMAGGGTAAVLLPGAAIFLGESHRAPARRLIDAGVRVALSTDCNPGTCPSTHLMLMATLGCSWLGLTPHEALLGITREAAAACGLDDGTGTVRPGSPCDLVACDVPHWRHIPYRMGLDPVAMVFVGGERVARPTRQG